MRKCLEELESQFLSNVTITEDPQEQIQYSMYLIMLEELYRICKIWKDKNREQDYWEVLESNNNAVCGLIMRYAEPKHDYVWLLEHKGMLNSETRIHLAMLNLPEAKEPDIELFKMLKSWAKVLDDYLFSTLMIQGEVRYIEHFDSWLTLFCQAIFNPQNSLFVRSKGHPLKFYPNPELAIQPFHLKCFKFSGMIIALSLLHQVDTGVILDRVFLVNLVGKNLVVEDIKEADFRLYNGRSRITEDLNGVIQHRFVHLISKQVDFFRKGLVEVLGESMLNVLKLLEPEDLHWILHKGSRTKPVVEEIIDKQYDHNQIGAGADRLMYRYKQHAVPGHNITNWDTVKCIGRGSFGSVYKAISANGSIFAVKEVSLVNQKATSVEQLEHEINSLCQLGHPNIVKYLGTHRDERKLCVCLELVANGSLVDIYKEYELKESQISSYTKSILEGLKYLHDQNVVHRDIKCANILIADDGRVKLADFGLAKAIEAGPGFKSYAGSLAWMAPEFFNQDFREGELIGIANDIWSLGCTVLEMFMRVPPYTEPGLTREKLRCTIGSGELPPIPEYLSDDAKHFITSCLQVYPRKRPTTAQLLQHPFVNSAPPSHDHFFLEL